MWKSFHNQSEFKDGLCMIYFLIYLFSITFRTVRTQEVRAGEPVWDGELYSHV